MRNGGAGRYERGGSGSDWNQFRQGGSGRGQGQGQRFPSRATPVYPGGGSERQRGNSQGYTQVKALTPTGFGAAPAYVEHTTSTAVMEADKPLAEGIYAPAGEDLTQPILKTLRIYPFGVNRDRLTESARQLHVPIVVTNNQSDADAVITLKNYYRRQPERLQQAEQDRKLIIILKNNTVAQMQHALAHIFDIPSADAPADDEDDDNDGDGSINYDSDDPTMQAHA